MITAVVGSGGGLEILDIEKPKPLKGEIIVEMRACGICGTDLEKIGAGTETPPVLGHEVAGIIHEAGGDLPANLNIGDRVFIHHHVSCGKCWYCYNGSETMCELFKKTNIWPGGFSEYFKVPKTNIERGAIHKLPDDFGWIKATFIEPLATVIRAVDRSTIRPGYSIAVVGAGPMGMLFISYLNSLGAYNITAVEISSYRCSRAVELGASKCLSPERARDLYGMFDVVIHATGSLNAFKSSLKLARRGGEVVLFGAPPPGSSIEFPISRVFYDEIRITPSYSTTEKEIAVSIRMLQKNKVDISSIVTHIYTLRNLEKAFETARTLDNAIKVIVVKDRSCVDPDLVDRFIE